MKPITRINLISPAKACTFLVLAAFGMTAQAEYYYVENGPVERSAKCAIVKRHHCVKRCYTHCRPKHKRVIKRIYRPDPAVRYYEYYGPVTTPNCNGSGCYNFNYSCPSCYRDFSNYYVTYTRYAYVCQGCDTNNWVPGYMCNGRWVAGHWAY